MKHTSKYSLESLSYAKIGDAAAVLLIRSVNCSSIISAILRNKIVLLQHTRFIPGKAECWNSSLARVEVVQFSTYCLSHQKEERILDLPSFDCFHFFKDSLLEREGKLFVGIL